MICKKRDLAFSAYYFTTILSNPMKEKRLERSKKQNSHPTQRLLHYYNGYNGGGYYKKKSYYINLLNNQFDTRKSVCSK